MKVTIEQNNGETMVIETDAFALVAHHCNEARMAVWVNGNATPVVWAEICDGLEEAKKNISDNNPIVGLLEALAPSKDALSKFLEKLEKQEGKENEGV